MKNELVSSRLHNSSPTEQNHIFLHALMMENSGKLWRIAKWRIEHLYVFHIVKIFVNKYTSYSCLKCANYATWFEWNRSKVFTGKSKLTFTTKSFCWTVINQCFTSRCCDPLEEWRKRFLDAKTPEWISFKIYRPLNRPRWTTFVWSLPGNICVISMKTGNDTKGKHSYQFLTSDSDDWLHHYSKM